MERFDKFAVGPAPYKIGGFKRNDLADYFNNLGFKFGAEIGVRTGKFSEELCKRIDGLKLLSIDPYSIPYKDLRSERLGEAAQEEFYLKAKKRLEPYDCDLIREESLVAVQNVPYESLDFVFIDGNHEFDGVMCDIIEWAKRVKVGGIISGHDYYRFRNSGVVEAVDIYCHKHKIYKLFNASDMEVTWWFTKQ